MGIEEKRITRKSIKKQVGNIVLATLLLFSTVFMACGSGGENQADTAESDVGQTGVVAETDWWKNSWKIGERQEGEMLSVKAYVELEAEQVDFLYIMKREFYDSYGDKIYMLVSYAIENANSRYFLYCYDTTSGEKEVREILPNAPELGQYSIMDFDVTGENEIAFWNVIFGKNEDGDYEATAYNVIKTDMQGQFISVTNLLEGYREAGEAEEGLVIADMCYCDGNGYYYLIPPEGKGVYVFDNQGKTVMTLPYPGSHQVNVDRVPCDSGDGTLLFSKWNNVDRLGQIFWIDVQTGRETVLGTFSSETVDGFCIGDNKEAYYINAGKIIRLNCENGLRQNVFSLSESGINISKLTSRIFLNQNGELIIFNWRGDEVCYYVLTEEKLEKNDVIRIAQLGKHGITYAKGLAASFSRKNPQWYIEVESAEGDIEDYRSQIMAEMVSNDGPDLLWVSEEDMKILHEKGMIRDISDLIPQETMEQIFPGVIQAGTVNGQYVGLMPEVQARTMVAAKTVWEGSTWSVMDIINLAESDENVQLIFNIKANEDSPEMLFNHLVCWDLSHSPFIDFEEGISYFDSAEFKKALEFCKEYGDNGPYSSYEKKEMLVEGQCLGSDEFIMGLSGFSNIMGDMKEAGKIVGFPTEGESGNFLSGLGYIVVNAKTDNEEAISAYLQYLLAPENQAKTDYSSVREDVIRNSVVLDYEGKYVQQVNSNTYIVLRLKEDGTSYVEEYIEFMRSCVPYSEEGDVVKGILQEEVGAYFNGDKNVEEVCDIIHRRVQLYLEEKKS